MVSSSINDLGVLAVVRRRVVQSGQQHNKAVHWRRPGLWKSVEDVMRIYKMIDTHVAVVAAAASAVVATTQRESVEQMELEAKSV